MAVKNGSIQPGASVVMEQPSVEKKLSQLWFQDDNLDLRTALNDYVLSAYNGGKC